MQVLLLCKHRHHDERVQVDAFTEHPEVITAQHVHVKELQHLTANLQGEQNQSYQPFSCFAVFFLNEMIQLKQS